MSLSQSIEWWSRWTDILGVSAVIIGGILAVVTCLGWGFSWKSGKLKDEAAKAKDKAFEEFRRESSIAIASAQTDLAKARENQAKAEVQLLLMHRGQQGRDLSPEFTALLKGKPTGEAKILYFPNDTESFLFAAKLADGLKAVGWTVQDPEPIPDDMISGFLKQSPPSNPTGVKSSLPLAVRASGTALPITVIGKELPKDGSETPFSVLSNALATLFSIGCTEDASLDSAKVIVVIDKKR